MFEKLDDSRLGIIFFWSILTQQKYEEICDVAVLDFANGEFALKIQKPLKIC
jgi:hypothetical protein